MSNQREEIEELRQQMSIRIEGIVKELFPDKRISIQGNQIRVGNKGSLSITRQGAYVGFWKCFEQDEGGDIFRLVQFALGCDFAQAVKWCQSRSSNSYSHIVQAANGPLKTPTCSKSKLQKIKRQWSYCQPITDTLAESYLRQRAISVTLPDTLRFHPNLGYFRNYTCKYPALVCKIQDTHGHLTGLHAIYLDQYGRKITCQHSAKLSRGRLKGNAVYLGETKAHVTICEGVEDGLSLMQIHPDTFVMATLGTGVKPYVQLPHFVKRAIIASDKDQAGHQASIALQERLIQEGIEVEIIQPLEGKDFNEYLQIYEAFHPA